MAQNSFQSLSVKASIIRSLILENVPSDVSEDQFGNKSVAAVKRVQCRLHFFRQRKDSGCFVQMVRHRCRSSWERIHANYVLNPFSYYHGILNWTKILLWISRMIPADLRETLRLNYSLHTCKHNSLRKFTSWFLHGCWTFWRGDYLSSMKYLKSRAITDWAVKKPTFHLLGKGNHLIVCGCLSWQGRETQCIGVRLRCHSGQVTDCMAATNCASLDDPLFLKHRQFILSWVGVLFWNIPLACKWLWGTPKRQEKFKTWTMIVGVRPGNAQPIWGGLVPPPFRWCFSHGNRRFLSEKQSCWQQPKLWISPNNFCQKPQTWGTGLIFIALLLLTVQMQVSEFRTSASETGTAAHRRLSLCCRDTETHFW